MTVTEALDRVSSRHKHQLKEPDGYLKALDASHKELLTQDGLLSHFNFVELQTTSKKLNYKKTAIVSTPAINHVMRVIEASAFDTASGLNRDYHIDTVPHTALESTFRETFKVADGVDDGELIFIKDPSGLLWRILYMEEPAPIDSANAEFEVREDLQQRFLLHGAYVISLERTDPNDATALSLRTNWDEFLKPRYKTIINGVRKSAGVRAWL